MSEVSDAESIALLFVVFVLPALALAIAGTRARAPLLAARVSSGIAGVVSLVAAVALERLLNDRPPGVATLTMLGIGAVPLIPFALVAREKPGGVAMTLAGLTAVAIAITVVVLGMAAGLIGAIAEPGYPGGLRSFFVLVPAGCYVALQMKTIVALDRAGRHLAGDSHRPTADG